MKYVISLGGSLIVPNKVDYRFLKKFMKFIRRLSKKNKIVLVCGGGSVARKYIKTLRKDKASQKALSLVGIESTRLNARLVAGLVDYIGEIPETLSDVKKHLKKNNLVVCGALGARPNMTTDGNAADIAASIKADFINLTNVDGMYDKNPKTCKTAKYIPEISYKDFNKFISKIKYEAGQHFVLDQAAAKIISKHKVRTIIVNGSDIRNLKRFFKTKNFKGTVIS